MMGSPAASDDQDAVIKFLSDPASYGGHGEVERIDTHCSIVFLTADHAYKLKRAIRYASLDYTTRKLRQTACETEIVLNRRTAPELYVGVRSINRGPSGVLTFGGEGPALDHVVVMRRFAQSDLFDRMAQMGTLTSELMHALGDAVARLHLVADETPQHGGAEAIRRVIAANDRELAKVAGELDGAAVGTLSSHARTALDGLATLLDRRRNAGRVRRCHGDLRLANICLYAGLPTLFDCIEFSDEIGCIDVLYDLAFLLMDLHLHERGDLGNAVFNAYLDLAPETDGLRALPLFLALRAATRSYALAGSAGRRTDPEEAARLLAFARRHIDAGIEFLAPRHPVLIVLGGDPECGRTRLATSLASLARPAPGARILHLDQSGETTWPLVSMRTLAAGCSVLIEGALTKVADRTEAVELASDLGVSVLRFWAGTLPPNLDRRLWRTLGADPDALAALTKAGTLQGIFGAHT
jgi:aminoglycoside phosphotransferase family enzyme